MTELEPLLADLYEHLAETAERPVERTASRWVGEAEAVTGDLVGEGVDPEVMAERVGHVVELLENVDEMGDPAADENVAAARGLAEQLLAALEGCLR